jgi:hypothetical protein
MVLGVRLPLPQGRSVDYHFCLLQGDILSFGQSFDELRLVHPALSLVVCAEALTSAGKPNSSHKGHVTTNYGVKSIS